MVDLGAAERVQAPQLTLSGDLDDQDLNRLCRVLGSLHQLTPGASLDVNLRNLVSIGPASLAVLVSTLRVLKSRRICDPLKSFTAPDAVDLAAWLSLPALEQLLSGRAGRGQWDGGGAPTIRGCEPFSDSAGIDRALAAFQMSLSVNMAWPEFDRASFGILVSDLAKNVVQHAESDGVAALRVDRTASRIDLAIADSGIGIRTSLSRNPDHQDVADDVDAIRRAVGPSTTGDPGTGGGLGLYLARLVVEFNGGKFGVRSGEAVYEEEGANSRIDGAPRFPGTLIVAQIRTDRAFGYERIDAFLEQPSGMLG